MEEPNTRRAITGAAIALLFVAGWAVRTNLEHVADHRYNWMAANAIAAGTDVRDRPYGTWMQAWNTTCVDKWHTPLTDATVDAQAHLGLCKGFKKQPELSRAPMSALTSIGFLAVSVVAAAADPILATASAALAAGSYAWHSTGQADTIHIDHFGCTIFALAVARSLFQGLGRIGIGWLNVGFCGVLTATAAFAEPDDASKYATFIVAGSLITVLILSVGELYPLVFNLGVPAAIGIAFHERAHALSGIAGCTANLSDDQTADAVHATWHCCAVVLGVEAALAHGNTRSPLAASTVLLLVSLWYPEIAEFILLATFVIGFALCLVCCSNTKNYNVLKNDKELYVYISN